MIGFRLVLAAALLSLGSQGSSAAEVTIRWGSVLAASHPTVAMIERIAGEVKTRTGGRVEIQAFPNGQLGSSRDMIENVANGSQQVVNEGAANFGAWVPSISALEAPYIWRDADHLVKAMGGAIGEEFSAQLVKARGMRILGTLYYGTRHVTSSAKDIKTPADMVGFKFRVPENDVFKAMAEVWGAKPTPMNFNELYLALKQGVVDGQENPLPTIKSGKLFEVQKYLVLTGHIVTPMLVVINEAFWEKMKPEDRKVVQDEIAKGIAWSNQQIIAAEATLVDEFKAAGMTVVKPDVESFRKPVLAAVPAKFEAKWGKGTFDRIQAAK